MRAAPPSWDWLIMEEAPNAAYVPFFADIRAIAAPRRSFPTASPEDPMGRVVEQNFRVPWRRNTFHSPMAIGLYWALKLQDHIRWPARERHKYCCTVVLPAHGMRGLSFTSFNIYVHIQIAARLSDLPARHRVLRTIGRLRVAGAAGSSYLGTAVV